MFDKYENSQNKGNESNIPSNITWEVTLEPVLAIKTAGTHLAKSIEENDI